ncbi:hypothetical protein WMY93_019618 [Mugilogobius chulae]|uniref:Uncharacterized protein n=1 Tax=Mugilogobius chulae TaxID=88201 RepID=A0AAW0NQ01_9GOBI
MLQPLVSALLGVGRALVMLQPLVSALLGVGRALVMLQPLVSALLGVGRSVSALLGVGLRRQCSRLHALTLWENRLMTGESCGCCAVLRNPLRGEAGLNGTLRPTSG